MANTGKHTGDFADLRPLIQRVATDGRCAEISQTIARALMGKLPWPGIVQAAHDLPLSNPEAAHLREIARAGNAKANNLHRALVDYVKWLTHVGQNPAATYFAEVARDLAGDYVSADLLIELATLYRLASDYDAAWATWTALEALGTRMGNEEHCLRALNGKGLILQRRGNLPLAEHTFRLVRSGALVNLELRGHGSTNLGCTLERMGRLPEAIEAHWEAFQTYPPHCPRDKWYALLNVAVAMRLQGQLVAADNALWLVERRCHNWLLETTAKIERLDVATMLVDRLEMQRLGMELQVRLPKMQPDVRLDYYYRLGLWAQREGRNPDRYFNHALSLAERYRLGEWENKVLRARSETPATPEPQEDGRLAHIIIDLDLLAATSGKFG